jgi:hypothetical protein
MGYRPWTNAARGQFVYATLNLFLHFLYRWGAVPGSGVFPEENISYRYIPQMT